MSTLSNAKIHFNEQGTPVASLFDDVYFSNDGGLAETDYVFLQQNGLPLRWQSHADTAFHIIETGFGTGANFLLTWLRFRQYRQSLPAARCQRLYFSSIEKYPLSHTDLRRALAVHAELSELGLLLLKSYPLCVAGCHRLSFDNGTVLLDLWFGDVNSQLPQLNAKVNAIYLDGFAPSKNPDMWQPPLFNGLARLSTAGTTLATFTAAGLVKRGLQDAGFTVEKVKGFGRKREMLSAYMAKPAKAVNAEISGVTIIGGGVASFCLALALQQRGIAVHLICEDQSVALQASQNRQAAVYPNLHAHITDESLLHVQAFLFARNFYQHWAKQGLDFAMDWCGVLHLASNEQLAQRQQKFIEKALYPTSLVCGVSATEASAIAGLAITHSGVHIPLGGWLSPQQFCLAALAYLKQSSSFQISFNCQVSAITQQQQHWLLTTTTGKVNAQVLVLATGSKLASFSQTAALPLNKIRGQVSHVQQAAMAPLQTVLCHNGYITPQWQGIHCLGATFDRHATVAEVTAKDNVENLQQVNEQLQQPIWLSQAKVIGATASFRASFPGSIPAIGAINNSANLYILGGMGARGIMLSPLLAELVACQICAEPLPLSQQLISKLSASRFYKE